MKTTSTKSLARVPAKCPRCGKHEVSWSPKRVWCAMCSFQMAAKPFERSARLVKRWNLAVNDGVGYYDLVRENNAREATIYNPFDELFQ